MEVEAWIAIFFILFVSCCLIIFRKNKNLAPGPKSLPIIGHLHLLIKGPAPNILLKNLAEKYGPLMSLRFGSVPVLVVSNREAAKEVMKTHDQVFASRPPTTAGRLLFYNYQNFGFIPYGERWRQIRRICTLELFTSRRLDSYKPMRMYEVRALMKSLRSSAGCVVDMRESIGKLTFNIISQMLISKRYCGEGAKDSSEGNQYLRVMAELFEICGAFSIGEYLPYLRWLDIDKIEARFKAVSKAMDNFLDPIIAEHEEKKKNGETEGVEDFVDLMIKLRDNGEECLKDQSIKAILIDLFNAGSDTSLVMLEWALAELIKHPQIMNKVQEEISSVVGDERLVEESDISDLPYLQAVVKETFRLHPAAPLLIPHFNTEDCTVMGYHIPKGTTTLINVYAIARDLKVWKDPLEFIPERFLENNVDIRGQDYEVIPFGSGRRMCPGIAPGLATVHLTLANLVHSFDWNMPEGEVVDTVNEKYGLTVPPATTLKAIPVPRLSINL